MAKEKNEEPWAEKICKILNDYFDKKPKSALHAKIQVDIPYGIKIKEFKIKDISKNKEHWTLTHDYETDTKTENKNERESMFTADLLIYEKKNGGKKKNKDDKEENVNIIPRVVMEAKYKRFTTHDPMTYGKKATLHRALMPTLRYGMILGAMGDKGLAGRLFEHGDEFDFLFGFKGEKPSDEDEQREFFRLVDSEIKCSKNLEKMFESWGKSSDYYCLQRNLILKKTRKDTKARRNGMMKDTKGE